MNFSKHFVNIEPKKAERFQVKQMLNFKYVLKKLSLCLSGGGNIQDDDVYTDKQEVLIVEFSA